MRPHFTRQRLLQFSIAIIAVFASVTTTRVSTAQRTPHSNSQRTIRTSQRGSFTVAQLKSYPFPNELTAAAAGEKIAWAFNERGLRNIWVAEGPEFKPRRLTNYELDDAQELTSVSISDDGKFVVYVRGGDHGSNFDSSVGVDPMLTPVQMKVQIWSVPFEGGQAKLLSDGDEPVISPKNDRVVFVRERAIWSVPIDGSAPAKRFFYARGESGAPAVSGR